MKINQQLLSILVVLSLVVSISFILNLGKKPQNHSMITKTNDVFVTNYITITNLAFVNPVLKYKCPVHTNKWHEITENCLDYEK